MLREHRCGATRTGVVLVLAVGALAVSAARRPTEAGGVEPAHVTVIGADYAFTQLPPTLAAGPTFFAFENRGTKRHEMSIALLRPEVAIESLISGADRPAVSSRAVSDSIIGLLIARPGERSGGQLYANLIRGRTYVVICTLRDTPDARPHADLGMVGSFQVH